MKTERRETKVRGMKSREAKSRGTEVSTKQRIIEAARTQFSERSWLGVTMADIAQQVGISKPALYHHFASKTELYAVVMDDVAEDLRARIAKASSAAAPGERLYQVVRGYLEFGITEKNLMNALVVNLSPDDSELRGEVARSIAGLEKEVEPIIDDIIAERHLTDMINSALVTELLFAVMDGLILHYSFLDKIIDPEVVADRMIEVFGLHRRAS